MIIVSCCFCIVNKSDGTEDAVLNTLQGEWEVIHAESNGKAISTDKFSSTYLIFQGNLLIPDNYPDDPAEVRLDPDKKPPWIDLSPRSEERMLGIYRIDGSRLIICLSTEGNSRPVKFKTSPDTDTYLMELRKKMQ